MPSALTPDAWHDFFLATGAMGASLAGLVFVAFSINLREILRGPAVVQWGAEALVLLLSIAATAVVGLWPASRFMVGLGIAAVGVAVWSSVVYLVTRPNSGAGAGRPQYATRVILDQLATLPTIAAGLSLAAAAGPGLDLLVLATLASLLAGVMAAWVLLVEIVR